MKVLSIDLGASSGRCMVVHHEQQKIRYEEVNRFKNIIIQNDHYLRWDIDHLIKNILQGIMSAFEKYPDIASIGIDTWGVDYCLINHDGDLIENPICYRDSRTEKIINEALNIMPFKDMYMRTGIQFLPFNSVFQLYHDFTKRRLLMEKVDKILMIPDYIAYVLTGQKRLEATNASTMGVLNVKNFEIDDFLLSELKINRNIFPKIIQPGEVYGEIKTSLIPSSVDPVPVIATCSHDTSSATLGTPIDQNSIFISSGTWSLLGVELNKPFINQDTLKASFTNELGYQNKINFLKNITGMFIINQMLSEWELYDQKVEVASIARIIDDAPTYQGFIDVDDEKFAQPGNMLLKIKKYLKNTDQYCPVFQGQWIDLVYMSMAAKYKYYIDKLNKLSDHPFQEIVICGGGNQADILNQYIANFTNLKVVQGPIEATVLGNALAQLVSLNDIKDEMQGRKIILKNTNGKTYYPQDVETFANRYQEFLKKTKLGD